MGGLRGRGRLGSGVGKEKGRERAVLYSLGFAEHVTAFVAPSQTHPQTGPIKVL